jgi:hypothetical protein
MKTPICSDALRIAARVWHPLRRETWYVSEVPGDGGVDWGYVTDRAKALPLSPYWQRRFRADMRRVAAVGVRFQATG